MSDVRTYRSSDLNAVADLYRRAYHGDRARRGQAFEWIHEHNPWTDPECVYLLLWEDGQVAGYLGRSPARLYIRGRPVPVVYSQEALVDPALRGRGVASTLFEMSNRTPRPMISLWHNDRIVSLLGKSGWTRVGPLPTLRRYYRMDRLAATRFRGPVARIAARALASVHAITRGRARTSNARYAIETVESFGPEFDALCRVAASQQMIMADRGARVLDWKYGAIPHQRYHRVAVRRAGQLRAYGILQIQTDSAGIRTGKVIDALGDATEPEAMDELAVFCDRYFRSHDVDLAICMIAPPRFQQAFRRVGYRQVSPTPTSWLWIRNQACLPSGEASLLERMELWYLTLGDSDGEMW